MMSLKSLSGNECEQQVQRSCGRDRLDRSKGQKEGQCDWKIASDGVFGRWDHTHREGTGDSDFVGQGEKLIAVGSQWRDLSYRVLKSDWYYLKEYDCYMENRYQRRKEKQLGGYCNGPCCRVGDGIMNQCMNRPYEYKAEHRYRWQAPDCGYSRGSRGS